MKNKTILILIITYILSLLIIGCNQMTSESDLKTKPVYIEAKIAPNLPSKESQYKLVTDFANAFYTFDYRYDKPTHYNKNKLLMTQELYTFLERDIQLNYLEETMSQLTSLTIEGYEDISQNKAKVYIDMHYKGTSTHGFPLEETKEDHLRGYIEIVNDNQWLVNHIDIKNLGSAN